MNQNIKTEFYKRFCPHRGVGSENTLQGIRNAVLQQPFLSEFDVRPYNGRLHLGHPPDLNLDTTLEDILVLFENVTTIPKIDLKLDDNTFKDGLEMLISQAKSTSRKILVNIDGELSTAKFMQAEAFLLDNTSKNILLNIDLIRYKNISNEDIEQHINSLARAPFSLSPNIESDFDQVISFVQKHGINQSHFWSFYDKQYSLDFLCMLMKKTLDYKLQVYFDIKNENIAQDEAKVGALNLAVS